MTITSWTKIAIPRGPTIVNVIIISPLGLRDRWRLKVLGIQEHIAGSGRLVCFRWQTVINVACWFETKLDMTIYTLSLWELSTWQGRSHSLHHLKKNAWNIWSNIMNRFMKTLEDLSFFFRAVLECVFPSYRTTPRTCPLTHAWWRFSQISNETFPKP